MPTSQKAVYRLEQVNRHFFVKALKLLSSKSWSDQPLSSVGRTLLSAAFDLDFASGEFAQA
jgi:hypothetical protein